MCVCVARMYYVGLLIFLSQFSTHSLYVKVNSDDLAYNVKDAKLCVYS